MKAEQLKGHLELMLLAIVAGGPKHGYAIIEELRERSGGAFDLPEGTVYPALYRLEAGGLLASGWSRVNGRRRRDYELSGPGREALRERESEWRAFARAVDSVITRRAPWTNPA